MFALKLDKKSATTTDYSPMLHTFVKKTEKTPLKELRLAKERLDEVKKDAKNT
jgi:phage-related protein